MAAQLIPINPRVLAWAIDERGLTVDDLARSMNEDPAVVGGWVTGSHQPTKGQWTALASKLKRPRSVFLLPEPPEPSVPPQMRTAMGSRSHDLRPDELLQVRRARRLQRYLASLLAESEEAADPIPPVEAGSDPESVGRLLRQWLRVSVDEQLQWETATTALASWRAALEARGLVVLQLRLGREGMRGFSLLHDAAPIIAVNTAETSEARSFTLMHELAHLASRTEASCALPPARTGSRWQVERWCDRVAAAVLLPDDAVRRVVAAMLDGPRPPADELGLARRTATKFQSSLRAAAIRLIDVGLADEVLYATVERTYPNRDRDKPRGGTAGGQPAPERRLSELGYRTTDVFLDALGTRRITERDARELLRLDGAELGELRSLVTEPMR